LFFTNYNSFIEVTTGSASFSSATLCFKIKIVEKMKISDGIEFYAFSMEKVLKKYGICF